MRIHHPHLYSLSLKILSRFIFLSVLLTGLTGAQESHSKNVSNLIEQLKHSDSNGRMEAVEALRKIGKGAEPAVPQLIEALKDPNKYVRAGAASALRKIGKGAEAAVPQLIEALRDPDERVRSNAADALGRIGEGAKEAVPQLAEALKDPEEWVRMNAAFALKTIGKGAEGAVPQLIEALKDPDELVRGGVAEALQNIGKGAEGAVPQLIRTLKEDPDEWVRARAADALGAFGEGAKEAVPQLIEALKDPDERVRSSAARALSSVGEGAEGAVPQLIEALKGDTDEDVRSNAGHALNSIRGGAKEAVPQLIEALKGPDERVRANAAVALAWFGEGMKEAVPQLLRTLKEDANAESRASAAFALRWVRDGAKEVVPELTTALNDPDKDVRKYTAETLALLSTILAREKVTESGDQLNTAADVMQNSTDPDVKEYADRVQQAGDLLKLIWWEQLKRWAITNPTISLAIAAFPMLLLAWLVLLWLRPLWLLYINESLAKTTDVKLPDMLGGFNVAPRYIILVGFFHYHPRVLNAWVTKHISSAQKRFSGLPTVEERKIYVPLPVILGNESEADLSPDKLRPALSSKLICLQIWGEGGSGKTSMACRLAQWAMSSQKETRLHAAHLMLPVLIEQDLVCQDKDPEHPLLKAIKQQVRAMIDEDEPPPAGLLRQLLKKRRVLAIIDGFSEMSEASRAATLAGVSDLPVNATIITTRADEQLGAIPKTEVKPLRVKGNRLSTFMEAYLTARKKRDLFDDDEFFEACRRLSLIVGDRDITALLSKLYAEQMIAVKEGATSDDAPENIPELMLSYLNDLCRNVGSDDPDIRIVHRAAKSIAWECLRKTLQPMPARREDVLLALGGGGLGEPLLRHMEGKLKVVQTVGAGYDWVRFALDPLAEYLAGMRMVDENDEDEQAWRSFLARVDKQGSAPEDVKGFLLALRDCCLAKGESAQGLRTIADELARRAGISPEEEHIEKNQEKDGRGAAAVTQG